MRGSSRRESIAETRGSYRRYWIECSLHRIFAAAKNSACVRDVAEHTRLIKKGIFIPGILGMKRTLHMKLLAKFSAYGHA